MLTLLRREEKPPGLTRWLTSANPVEQQYAAESLAEMGDTYGTDCLILLASLEDRERRKRFVIQSVAILLICFALGILWIAFATHSFIPSLIIGNVASRLLARRIKASRLQQTAVEKLAEGRNPAAVSALVDALWRADSELKNTAEQGLVKLLPRAGKDLKLSPKQWDLLLSEINPSLLASRKTTVNSKFVLAILQAVTAADYFPAAARVQALASSRKTFWTDAMIRSNACDCVSKLSQRYSVSKVRQRISSRRSAAVTGEPIGQLFPC